MKLVSILLLILLHSSTFYPQENGWSLPEKFDSLRDPAYDLKKAVELAESSGRRIVLDVGGEWCIWCHRMDDFISTNEELKNKINENFIWLKINYSKENKNEEFLSRFPEIKGYPHLFVLEWDGTLLHSQNTGELEKEKDYDLNKFLDFVNDWQVKKQTED